MVENLFKPLIPTGVNTKVYILNLQRFLSAPEVSTKAVPDQKLGHVIVLQ